MPTPDAPAVSLARERWILSVLAVWMWTLGTVARAPMAIALLALCATAAVTLRREAPYLRWSREIGARWRPLLLRPDYYLPGGLLLAYLVSAAWIDDWDFLRTRVQLSAQALGIPLAFYLLDGTLGSHRGRLWLAFGAFAAVLAVGLSAYTLVNLEAMVAALGQSRSVPTAVGHVRTGMILAVGAVAMAWQAVGGRGRARERWLGGALAVVLLAGIHVVAIRTALAMTYVGLAVMLLRLVLTRWTARQSLAAAALVVGGVGVTAATSPTLVRKAQLMAWDVGRLGRADATDYSDGGRVASQEAGLRIVAASPWLGAAPEGLRARQRAVYAEMGLSDVPHLPHNQWLFSWAAVGVLGAVGVACVVLAPAFRQNWLRRPLVAEMTAMVAALTLADACFESDVGIGVSTLAIWLAKAGEE